jgi:hypothetical protein
LSPDESSEMREASDAWDPSSAELTSIQSDHLAGEWVGVSEISHLMGMAPSAALVYDYLRRNDGPGGDVRRDMGVSMRVTCWPSYADDLHRGLWQGSVATPWRLDSHINTLVLKMFQSTLQGKTGQLILFESHSLHLLDSQVLIAVTVKGGSSSRRLNQILWEIVAVSFSADLYSLLAYIASALNSADGAFRRFYQWRKVKRNC